MRSRNMAKHLGGKPQEKWLRSGFLFSLGKRKLRIDFTSVYSFYSFSLNNTLLLVLSLQILTKSLSLTPL